MSLLPALLTALRAGRHDVTGRLSGGMSSPANTDQGVSAWSFRGRWDFRGARCRRGVAGPPVQPVGSVSLRRRDDGTAKRGHNGWNVLHAEGHAPLLGELEGIRQEVLEHLLDPLRIGADAARKRRLQVDGELEALSPSCQACRSRPLVTGSASSSPPWMTVLI